MDISIHAEPMVDPRGVFLREVASLAPRPAALKGKTVLLFDNTQLTSLLDVYGPIFRWLEEYLTTGHGAICRNQARNIMKGDKEDVAKLADEVARSGADGVVIALCNAGITSLTSLFAAELELRGMPCVQICTDLGYPLARAAASSYVPGLPILVTQPATGGSETFGKDQVLAIAPEVVWGLTSEAAALLERFKNRASSPELGIAENGIMRLPAITVATTDIQGKTAIEVDPGRFAETLYEALCAADLCDGLPIITPTEKRIAAMLRHTDLAPEDHLVREIPPSGGTLTVRSLAANAVMAGCRPEYFPILVAAFQAIADPAYRIFQTAISTHPGGHALVVSGPLAEQLGIQSGQACLGPGFRANATIGRSINLTLMNVSRSVPGKSDLCSLSSPARFAYCFADSTANNPWQTLNADLYGPETTSVTVHKCEGPHLVHNPPDHNAENLLKAIATVASAGGNNLVYPGHLLVILNPTQARMIEQAGWSKRDIKEFLFEHARQPVEVARRRHRNTFPPHFLEMPQVPVMRSPDDVILVVCGGDGGHAMVGVPWGLAQAVSRPVVFKDGTPVRAMG